MTAASQPRSAVLYTPEILALTTELASWRDRDGMPIAGSARSRTCGSTIDMALAVDSGAVIERVGMQVSACAIGQASAAIFAAAARGRTAIEIDHARKEIAAWLVGDGPRFDWPRIEMLTAARAHPGRHSAILLAWEAAAGALSSGENLG